MQRLGEKHHAPTTEAALRLLALRLRSRQTCAALADEVTAQRVILKQARDLADDAADTTRMTTLVVGYLDALLDISVKVELKSALALATAALPPKQREVLSVQLFAGKSPSEGMKNVGGPAQEGYVDAILAHLATDPFKALAPQAATIKGRKDDLAAGEKARAEARVAEQVARTALETANEAAKRFYNLMPGRIEAVVPDDGAFLESCFLDLRSAPPDQGVETQKRALTAVYRARHGTMPREVHAGLDDAMEKVGFEKLIELFATRSPEEIAAAVVVKK